MTRTNLDNSFSRLENLKDLSVDDQIVNSCVIFTSVITISFILATFFPLSLLFNLPARQPIQYMRCDYSGTSHKGHTEMWTPL